MTLATVLLSLLVHMQHTTQATQARDTVSGGSVYCVTEPRSVVGHNRHAFACLNVVDLAFTSSTPIVGAVLKSSGAVACQITGSAFINDFGQTCVEMTLCTRSGSVCQ